MQRVGASFVGKKIYDYLTSSPEAPPQPDPDEPVAAAPAAPTAEPPPDDDLHGQLFLDGDEQPLGIAQRLADVAVYVVTDGYGDPARHLAAALEDPETRLFWRTVDGRLSALIYVPDPSRAPARPAAMRADEV